MSYSLAIFSIGFLLAWLGAVMVYLSLRRDHAGIENSGVVFLSSTVNKANESRRLVKFVITIALVVTAVLYVAAWLKLIAW